MSILQTGSGLNQQVAKPDLRVLLELLKTEVMLALNCHAIGTIQSFNSTLQTAQVTINYKKTYAQKDPISGAYSPELVDYPVLVDCPVVVLSGGTAALTFPIAVGDTCLVLFNDRDIDNWFASGTVGPVNTNRTHSFTDAIALVGIRSMLNPHLAYNTDNVVLSNALGSVEITPDGKTKITNSIDTLNDLLQDLVTQINSLVTQTAAITVICAAPASPSSIPVNAAAITAISAQLTTIATQLGALLE